MKKVYLREIKISRSKYKVETSLEIFEGDIEKDKKYWKQYHDAISVRYFELKDVIPRKGVKR